MRRHRLRALTPFAAILFLVACGGGAELPSFEMHEPLAAGQLLAIRNLSGTITVVPSTDGQLSVHAAGSSQGSRPEAVHVVKQAIDGGVAVCALWGRDAGCAEGSYSPSGSSGWQKLRMLSRVRVDFTVKVPAGVTLDIRDVDGNVNVTGATGDLLVHAVNGRIKATAVGGVVELTTVNGSVQADVSGVPQRLSAKTVNGTVDVTGPATFGGDVDMGAINGGVSSDFAITTVGSLSRRKLVGHIGTGSAQWTLKSVNGAVSLHKRT